MSKIKLISVDFLYNYVEEGDKLYITTTWENTDDEAPDFDAEIVADIVFSGQHRLEGGKCDNYSFSWKPFPSTFMWNKGNIWSTTGAWPVSAKWGGSYDISISLKEKNGKSIEFIGKDGLKTFCQPITEIDIGWGWGRPRLLEQRTPLNIKTNDPSDLIDEAQVCSDELYGLRFNKKYISVCGFQNECWIDFPSIIELRRISDNSTVSFIGDNGIDYNFSHPSPDKIKYTAKNAFCSFDLIVQKTDAYFSVFLYDVWEADGYELISVEIPSLIQASGVDASLINYFGGGRRIPINNTLPQTSELYFDACSAVGAVSEIGSFAVIANDVDNVFRQSVIRRNLSEKVGIIGVVIRNYIKADKAGMKSIPVSTRKLEVHYSSDKNSILSAEHLRERLPSEFNKLYDNTLFYKIRLDASGQYNPERPETYSPILTLIDAEKIIMQVSKISGGMKQVVYLVGWQRGGHDFEYPYPYLAGFNKECGTLEEFKALRSRLKKFNVELSLHDNFDDAYLSDSYEINKDILSINAKGEIWKGWLWAGGMSYIISPTAYLRSSDITERIEAVFNDYEIDDTYHLDVLSSEVRRYSFAQNELSSAQQNIDSKIKIIELFNEKGIDVTSETLSLPFIGKMGYAQNTRYNFDSKVFMNEEILPLTTIAFHGVTPYKMGADGTEKSLLRAIACGASCSIEIEDNTEDMTAIRNMARNIYIVSVPMSALSYKRVTSADISDNKWVIGFENNSCVSVDFKNMNYSIVNEGKVISENFETFMPLSVNRYCYYSIKNIRDNISLPADWEKVTVYEIGDRIKSFDIETQDGVLSFNASTDTPYIIEKREN